MRICRKLEGTIPHHHLGWLFLWWVFDLRVSGMKIWGRDPLGKIILRERCVELACMHEEKISRREDL